jgi:hypothetical protein
MLIKQPLVPFVIIACCCLESTGGCLNASLDIIMLLIRAEAHHPTGSWSFTDTCTCVCCPIDVYFEFLDLLQVDNLHMKFSQISPVFETARELLNWQRRTCTTRRNNCCTDVGGGCTAIIIKLGPIMLFRTPYSAKLRCETLVRTDAPEECSVFIIRVTRIVSKEQR